jgi:xanthine dehydrogenase accessory factor
MTVHPLAFRGERPLALIKGAGDLATGVSLRLLRSGFAVVHTEVPQPTMVRRTVSFAEAVYAGKAQVEDHDAVSVRDEKDVWEVLASGRVPILVDPAARSVPVLRPLLLVDAIVAKRNLGTTLGDAPAVVALGPGFRAGRDCHAVVETMRGHSLGRVIWRGEALPNTGVPGEVGGAGAERVLRAPRAGLITALREIGDSVRAGDIVAEVEGQPVRVGMSGVLRGLLRAGLQVTEGMKVGDVDPRAERSHCFSVSDKALAIGGGVLEAACALLGGVRFDR